MRSTAPFAVSAAPSRARGRWLRAPVRRTTAAIASPTNGPDEVASVTSRVHVARTPQTFEYDYDGNQTLVTTKTGTWRVTYNGENRPVRWTRINAADTNDQTTVLMSFDHQGRRRMYLEVNANGTTNRLDRFTYDNYLCVARNRWQPDGTSAADRVVWDPTEPVATRPLVFYQSNDPPQFYAIDGNKNVSELVSSADGSISAHYEYAPFGEVILSFGDLALTNPFRFSSEYADDTLVLVYYNYRHLEPVTGRWLNVDIIEDAGGVNMYALSKNSLNLDRLGLKECVLSQMDVDPAGWVLAEYSFGRKEALNGYVFVDEIVSKWELKAKVQCCCWQWNWGWGNKPKIIRSEISKFVEKRQSLDQGQQCVGYTPTGLSSIPSPTTITAVFGEIGAQLISKGVSSAMVFFTETDARRLAAQIMAMRPSSIQEVAWPWDKCK